MNTIPGKDMGDECREVRNMRTAIRFQTEITPESVSLLQGEQYPVGIIMQARILVTFATRNGSTAEIAQAIGKELASAGHTVDVTEMNAVSSLKDYTAVVIGAPLYMGSIDGAAGKFVKQYSEHLSGLPVAAFAVGLAPKSPEPSAVEMAMIAQKKSLEPLTPVSSVLFAGKLDPAKVNFVMRKFLEMAKIPAGDFRDWSAIAAWARELPGIMKL